MKRSSNTASGMAPSRFPTVTMHCVRVMAATSLTSDCIPSRSERVAILPLNEEVKQYRQRNGPQQVPYGDDALCTRDGCNQLDLRLHSILVLQRVAKRRGRHRRHLGSQTPAP